jgi:cephalosporin-C deacetylase
MKKYFVFVFCTFLTTATLFAQTVALNNNWQFSTTNATINTITNITNWQYIAVGKSWEGALNITYDGVAWYKNETVFISAALKPEAEKAGFIMLQLGKIDDADETYVNGQLIGKTGNPQTSESAWAEDRAYRVPLKYINFNANNTIAIKVYDWGGGGGLYTGNYAIEANSWRPFLKQGIENRHAQNETFTTKQNITLNYVLQNSGNDSYLGYVNLNVYTFTNQLVKQQKRSVRIKPGLNIFNFDFGKLPQNFYKTTAVFNREGGAQITINGGFAINPEKAIKPFDAPTDFETFWRNAKTELDAITPNYKITKNDTILKDTNYNVYLVEMQSLENETVRGWLVTPKGKTNLPAILNVPGYSAQMLPWRGLPNAVVFYFNIRGHGNSKSPNVPGFPGYLLHNLSNKQKYIYKGAYMDCVRAIDFLTTCPEVNKNAIGVTGASQGGALSFAAAALDARVKALAPDVPFLSDFKTYFEIAEWPANEFKLAIKQQNLNENEVYQSLAYFDIKNLATKITQPIFMGVGLRDVVCPPAINFAAFNNTKSTTKSYELFAAAGHSLPAKRKTNPTTWLIAQLVKFL